MIKVRFSVKNNRMTGFEVSGHASFAPYGKDIVCAAVSSAAIMAADTITDVIGAKANVLCKDGLLKLHLEEENKEASAVLRGLRLHLRELSKQYPQNIRIIYGGNAECLI